MLGVFVAGRYSGAYNASDLGMLTEGWRLRWNFGKDAVEQTDEFGVSYIEGFFLGCNMWVGGQFEEWKTENATAVSPWSTYTTTGTVNFDLGGPIGVADSATSLPLILSATVGTPAASSPASATFHQAIIDANFNVEQLYGPRHRVTPFMFRIVPYNPTGTEIRYASFT